MLVHQALARLHLLPLQHDGVRGLNLGVNLSVPVRI